MPGQPTSSPPDTPMRVLVVDDDPTLLSALERHLRRDGFLVEKAHDGLEGFAKAKQFAPDIILSDWSMPALDGRGLCNRIKADSALGSTYFIMLTGRDEVSDRVSGLELGADAYLTKPCAVDDLVAHLRAAERIVHLQQQLRHRNDELRGARNRLLDELERTSAIQMSLLPQRMPSVPRYTFAARYLPQSQCGGDYYDVIPLESGKVGLVVGDVVGHGAPAMVAMAVVRCLVHGLTHLFERPDALLTELDRLLSRHLPTKQFITAICAVLDPARNRLVYGNAGHPPPILIERTESIARELDVPPGVPLNITGFTPAYCTDSVELREGDRILIYTDGLTEMSSSGSDVYGPENLLASVRAHARPGLTADAFVDGVMSDVDAFAAGVRARDDRTLLVLSRDA